MKKYRLLKDLPWMSAGTVVWVEKKYLHRKGCTLMAECYEATKNYFWTDENGNFDANANPAVFGNVWFEEVTENPELAGRTE